jgi:hypothetical protein
LQPGSRAGDVIFTIVEKKEDAKPFQRIGATNDLLYTQHLTLHEALTGAAFPIIHMDNRVLLVRPHEYGSYAGIIKTGDMVVIRVRSSVFSSLALCILEDSIGRLVGRVLTRSLQGEGMPVPKIPAYSSAPRAKAGDLHIIFNVVFPTHDDIAKSEEKKKVQSLLTRPCDLAPPHSPMCRPSQIFARVVEDLALLQPREPIESVIAGRSVVPVFATKAPAKPTSSGSSPDDHRNGADARARRKAEKRKKRGGEDDKNDAESVKCHQQ